jgi:hypothetical protein
MKKHIPSRCVYKAEKQRKVKNPNSKAAETKSNQNQSNGAFQVLSPSLKNERKTRIMQSPVMPSSKFYLQTRKMHTMIMPGRALRAALSTSTRALANTTPAETKFDWFSRSARSFSGGNVCRKFSFTQYSL